MSTGVIESHWDWQQAARACGATRAGAGGMSAGRATTGGVIRVREVDLELEGHAMRLAESEGWKAGSGPCAQSDRKLTPH